MRRRDIIRFFRRHLALLLAFFCWPAFSEVNIDVIVTSGGTSDEEFVGPFANWIDAKTGKRTDGSGGTVCTGATGNGSTDDTAALQSCLNVLNATTVPVLYLPSGTYKISDASTTATASSGATTVTVASATGIRAGNIVLGVGIVGGTVVSGSYVNGSTSVPISIATSGTLSTTPVKFSLAVSGQIGVSIIGQDPSTTTITWSGTSSGTMFGYAGVTNSRLNRISFNGQNIANVIVELDWDNTHNYFPTGNELADDIFQNAGVGVFCGRTSGCSEGSYLRDTFTNLTSIGFYSANFNALNNWIWYSHFTNVGVGVGNEFVGAPAGTGAGGFSVYGSIFQTSTDADLRQGSADAFAYRFNYSSGSRRFVDSGGSCSANIVMLQGNTVVNTTNVVSVEQQDLGPTLSIGNVFASDPGFSVGPVVEVGSCFSELFSIGDTFTVTSPTALRSGGNNHTISPVTVARASLNPSVPTLPGTPPNNGRTIFEVTAGSSAATIQTAINNAVAAGIRSVVHLQNGAYSIATTLSTPANATVQIIGDGANTVVTCAGASPALKINGPSKVIVRDLDVLCDGADGIEINTVDQVGSRVYMEEVLTSNTTAASIFYDTLDYTLLEMHNQQSVVNPTAATSVLKVVGGASAAAGTWLGGAVNMFNGATATDYVYLDVSAGAHVVLDDVWYDAGNYENTAPAGHKFMTATGPASSAISLSGNQSHMPGGWNPQFTFPSYRGLVALFGTWAQGTVTVTGNGSGSKVAAIGAIGPDTFFSNTSSPAATTEFLNGIDNTDINNYVQLPEQGCCDVAFLTSTLAQVRSTLPAPPTPAPAGVTDVRIHRVRVEAGLNNIHIKN